MSRPGADLTSYFLELALPPSVPATSAVLEGEVVAIADGRPRLHGPQGSSVGGGRGPAGVAFVAFDALWIDDHPLLDVPCQQRRGCSISSS